MCSTELVIPKADIKAKGSRLQVKGDLFGAGTLVRGWGKA